MPDDSNPITDAAPAPSLPGTQQFWDDTLRYGPMPYGGALNPNETGYIDDYFEDRYKTLDKSMVHGPPHGNDESTVAFGNEGRSWEDASPLTNVSSLRMDTIPAAPVRTTPQVPTTWEHFPEVAPSNASTPVPAQTPPVTTGPATIKASTSPTLSTVRAMSFGPGNYPGADKPTTSVMYGALTDSKGNAVKLTTSDLAISPNLMQKHGLKLGDYVDVLDHTGNVVYAHQRLADLSYISKGKPTTDSIELWGRPDIGYAQIRRSY